MQDGIKLKAASTIIFKQLSFEKSIARPLNDLRSVKNLRHCLHFEPQSDSIVHSVKYRFDAKPAQNGKHFITVSVSGFKKAHDMRHASIHISMKQVHIRRKEHGHGHA